ncbi:MaoC family dehydratase N-terminal domain-containing protein [Bradyrhizobium sp. LHD-71]|uniref:FAS1-like dehydratase domain-containing protein n=1 Tax=Bradyrhizobium sp. LHD-71 TaxID=3072141 RepID=UPI00280F1392|nr:MaoC family dehydratase N-terminal domain-containing protein [Bradyrhizobium sp. LHD-71]MDQ8728263.1 MaoC family dehydratase N-terminal domain-containing protein [Bradyrhizobium sp. LHD-71]
MSTVAAEKKQGSTYGVLTEEGIARLKQRIGVQFNRPTPPHNYEVTWDGTRHFAYGYGDENPLWCDREYGKSTRWGDLIAPPNFLYTMGESDAPPLSAEQKALLKGDPLIGLGSYQAVMEFEWWQPLRAGDRLRTRSALIGVIVRDNSKFSGRTVSEVKGYIYRNQNDELTSIQRGTWMRAERRASAERKKEYDLPKPYTKEQLELIDATYEAETIRGANPLYFEDVKEGEALPTIVRGPMRTSDLIIWHIGWGMQLTPPGAFRLSYKIRKKAPGMYTPNPLGVPDTVQRLHWEKEWANELGIPISYDYGGMRETFLTNLVTNWMGDDGWLWKLSCQHRKFVYTGDTYWIKGKVKRKEQKNDRNEVHIDIWVENQWGTIVTPGEAVVLLPTRSKSVELPRPAADDIDAMYAHEVERYAQAR